MHVNCQLQTSQRHTCKLSHEPMRHFSMIHDKQKMQWWQGHVNTSCVHWQHKTHFFRLMSTGRRYFGQQRHKNIWQRHCEDFFRGQKKKQQHRIGIYLMPQWKKQWTSKQWTSRFFWYVNEKIMDDAKKSTSNTGSWFSVNGKLDASNALKKLRWRCLFRFMHCCMSMHSWNYG